MRPQTRRLSRTVHELLRCPVCRAKLRQVGEQLVCTNSDCDTPFPIVDGIPVLFNERTSVFSIDDVVSDRRPIFGDASENGLKRALKRFVPTISQNVKARENYGRLRDLLFGHSSSPRVLAIGASTLGEGLESLADDTSIDWVDSDVAFGPRTMLLCDAHDIPFEDGSFDGVIVQAVLEHVVDPYRCVEEIHRVLNDGGVVYAETPFMQQVHGGRYDFTRFTHLGHRRLFRRFDEIETGAVGGPGMALAWSYVYFLVSFTTSRTLRALAWVFATCTSFHLKYCDRYLIDKPGTLDAASGYYFMGRRAERVLSDRDLIKLYRGAAR